MDVTKPYKFIGFGAMDVTKPYKFIGFGAMDVTKPYKFIGFCCFLVLSAARSSASSKSPFGGRSKSLHRTKCALWLSAR